MQVLVLLQEPERPALPYLCQHVEREELRALGQVERAAVAWRGDVLGLDERDEGGDIVIYRRLEAAVFAPGVLISRLRFEQVYFL